MPSQIFRRPPGPRAGNGFLDSTLAQTPLILLFGVLAPAVVWYGSLSGGDLNNPAFRNTICGSAIASVLGLVFHRRVTAFPGVRGFTMLLPAYLGSYGLILFCLFAFRLDYARAYAVSCFVATLIGAFILVVWTERTKVRRFYVVPAGHVSDLLHIQDVEWQILDTPEVPADRGAIIVADLRYDHEPAWERMLAEAAIAGHPVYHTKQLRESLTGQVSIEHLSENSFGSLLPNLAYRQVKRTVDLVTAIALIGPTLLVMLLIALAIRIDSPGPVLYSQMRMGYRGRAFRMYKFRTMRPRAVVENEHDARDDAMTRSGDDRVTRLGRILRHLRLDELPQIFHIITGEMSWIGPRPEAIELSRWYNEEIPFYSYRHIVRPGITGWSQVNQGHVTSLDAVNQKLKFDFFYVKNFSAWIDLLIALRTIPTMLSGFGSR